MISVTSKQKATWLRKLIPVNSKGTLFAVTNKGELVVPPGYREFPSLGFRIDNQGAENDFAVTDESVSCVMMIEGNPEWINIPMEAIYYAQGTQQGMFFEVPEETKPPVFIPEDPPLRAN